MEFNILLSRVFSIYVCTLFPMQTAESVKKVCPRLRDSASGRRGEFTQPRTNSFRQLCNSRELNATHNYPKNETCVLPKFVNTKSKWINCEAADVNLTLEGTAKRRSHMLQGVALT